MEGEPSWRVGGYTCNTSVPSCKTACVGSSYRIHSYRPRAPGPGPGQGQVADALSHRWCLPPPCAPCLLLPPRAPCPRHSARALTSFPLLTFFLSSLSFAFALSTPFFNKRSRARLATTNGPRRFPLTFLLLVSHCLFIFNGYWPFAPPPSSTAAQGTSRVHPRPGCIVSKLSKFARHRLRGHFADFADFAAASTSSPSANPTPTRRAPALCVCN